MWVLGAVALEARAATLRAEVQRSAILQRLNTILPPTGGLLNTLSRLDPFPRIDGPEARVKAPRAAIAGDPEVDGARRERRQGAGHGVRARRRGLGLGGRATAGGDQRPRRGGAGGHARAARRAREPRPGRAAIAFDPRNDVAVLRVPGLDAPTLPLGERPRERAPPRPCSASRATGRTTCAPAGWAATREVITQDAYGRGPVRRSITSLRGAVRRGNSGGPMVDGRGRVVTTVFAATTIRPARRLRRAQRDRPLDAREGARGPVSTGQCAGSVSAHRYRPAAQWPRRSSSPRSRPWGATSPARCPGQFAKHEGYLESDDHVVTWAVGHLVQLAEPDEYDAKYKKWRMADLPIVPDDFRLVVRDERSRKQMTVITKLLGRKDVDLVINACDAGREGELIFAWTLREGRGEEARPAPVAVLDDRERDQGGVRLAAARPRSSPSSSRPPARARRPTGSSA